MTIGQYVKSKKEMSINQWIEQIKRENKIIINHQASFLKAINK